MLREAARYFADYGGAPIMPICADVACKIEALLLDLTSEIYGATAPECLDVATKRYLRSLKEFAVYMDHASYSIFLLEKSCSPF